MCIPQVPNVCCRHPCDPFLHPWIQGCMDKGQLLISLMLGQIWPGSFPPLSINSFLRSPNSNPHPPVLPVMYDNDIKDDDDGRNSNINPNQNTVVISQYYLPTLYIMTEKRTKNDL